MIQLIVATRYKVEFIGRESLNKSNLDRKGGVLFLPNHPAEVDPLIVGTGVWKKFEPRPLIVEWIAQIPVVGWVMRMMRAVTIPNFEQRASISRRDQADEAFLTIVEGLKKGDNFMMYPSGRLKSSEEEVIGGASGLHKIIQAYPDANIVLVRTTGLWGSSFSKAWNGKNVVFLDSVVHGVKAVLKNAFFFVPKRHVQVEYVPYNHAFPFEASRVDLNRTLEQWYNQKRDPLHLVPYEFWSKKVKRPFTAEHLSLHVHNVPKEVQDEIVKEVSRIAKILPSQIRPYMNLSSDLRLDSLDVQDLVTFLEERYKVSKIDPYQITTVASLMNHAASEEQVPQDTLKINPSSDSWKKFADSQDVRASIYGNSAPEAFFRIAYHRKKDLACADLIAKEVTYEKLMLSVILLSKKIEKLPGEYIGILMPASIAANVAVLATQMAKKIPVMINWTVGSHHLEAVKETTELKAVLTSKSFLKNIQDLDLKSIEPTFVYLEEMKAKISLYEKLKAALLIKFKYETLIKKLGLLDLKPDHTAVLLFTSGTETLPKGVPLSHRNILFDMKTAFDRVKTTNKDVILGFLPPFHSYGFTVCGLLPLVSGVRVIYYPNPTHYKKLAKLIEHWHVTFLAGAPTFLKGILQPAQKELYKSLRIVISGAEKAPDSLKERLKEACPQADFLEGYGLSECAPILTLNIPGEKHQGVGPALDGVEILILHPETNEPLPKGQSGQVLARGPNIFNGYLGPVAKSPFMEVNGEKWFKTGDLGCLDDRGYLTLVGRLKRQIKIGGEMVNLNALEEGLVKTCLAEGLMSAQENDEPALAICSQELQDRPRIILFSTLDLKLDDVNKKIKKLGFSNLHKVHKVEKVEKLPLMGSGKIHYRKLEEKLGHSA